MKLRPYYNDPYTIEFDADVVDNSPHESKTAVQLDKSFFYPTSGGQDHDTGVIGGMEVLDVMEENGNVVHILSGELPLGRVHCRIDGARRFSNMQQHTGQHILSAAFENLLGIQTVSSRLGDYTGTIDLSNYPTEIQIAGVVEEANRIIREDRPVSIHYAEREEIGRFNLRKPPKVDGTVRIIEVKDFDFSPCGGTHCTHTSEVGVILTGNLEKVKGSLSRIEFYCGGRAIRRFNELLKSTREASRLLSTSSDEVPAAVLKLKGQLEQKDDRIKSLSEKILEELCRKLTAVVDEPHAGLTAVDLSTEITTTEELRYVASCVSRSTKSSFAFYRIEENICYMNLNLAAAEEIATRLVNELRGRLGAKGGGRNGFYSFAFPAEKFEEVVSITNETLGRG